MSNANVQCQNCGQTNFPGDAQCRQCGAPLGPPPPQSWGQPQGQQPSWGQPQGQQPSWGQPQGQQPSWGAPQSGYGSAPSYGQAPFGGGMLSPHIEEAKKTARNAMIAGLVGLVCFGFILGILAIKWGNEARKSLVAAGVSDGQGMAIAGIVLGVLDILGWILFLVARIAGS